MTGAEGGGRPRYDAGIFCLRFVPLNGMITLSLIIYLAEIYCISAGSAQLYLPEKESSWL